MLTMKMAYIGFGSNLGEKSRNCRYALERIGRIPCSCVTAVSSLYLSEPVGVEDQDWYINGVIALTTTMQARRLLQHLQAIEAEMGRVRRKRWESRIIDLDILLYSNEVIREHDLTIPHPLMHLRRFVLSPLGELASGLIHPVLQRTITDLLSAISEGEQQVYRLEDH